MKPRFIPFDADQMDLAILYADAFFTDGERRRKAGHIPDGINHTPAQKTPNGWGYVLRIGGQVFYDNGVVPEWFVKILLEVLVQLAAFVTFAEYLPPSIIAFIDNTAGQAAV